VSNRRIFTARYFGVTPIFRIPTYRCSSLELFLSTLECGLFLDLSREFNVNRSFSFLTGYAIRPV